MPKFLVKFEKSYTVNAETESEAKEQAIQKLNDEFEDQIEDITDLLNIHVWRKTDGS